MLERNVDSSNDSSVGTVNQCATESRRNTSEFNRRILLVEDTEANVRMMRHVLHLRRHDVSVARNGEEALELAQAHVPDLMLLDLSLPGISGIEVVRQLRTKPAFAHVPILALTGAGDVEPASALAASCTARLSRRFVCGENIRPVLHPLRLEYTTGGQ